MSNDEQQGPGIFGIPLPTEVVEQMRKQHDMAHMQRDDVLHGIFTMIRGLDEDGIRSLRILINHLGEDPTGKAANYYEGIMTSMIESRFGECIGCGKKHDDVEDLLPSDSSGDAVEGDSVDEIMEKYGLEWAGEGYRPGTVKCTRCKNYFWPSIGDRKMKPADKSGCPSCTEKEKWG